MSIDETIQILMKHINKHKKENDSEHSDDYLKRVNEEVEKNKLLIVDFIKYVYILKVDVGIDFDIYFRVNNFIKDGILLKEEQ